MSGKAVVSRVIILLVAQQANPGHRFSKQPFLLLERVRRHWWAPCLAKYLMRYIIYDLSCMIYYIWYIMHTICHGDPPLGWLLVGRTRSGTSSHIEAHAVKLALSTPAWLECFPPSAWAFCLASACFVHHRLWYMIYDTRRRIQDIWYLIYDIWYMINENAVCDTHAEVPMAGQV